MHWTEAAGKGLTEKLLKHDHEAHYNGKPNTLPYKEGSKVTHVNTYYGLSRRTYDIPHQVAFIDPMNSQLLPRAEIYDVCNHRVHVIFAHTVIPGNELPLIKLVHKELQTHAPK